MEFDLTVMSLLTLAGFAAGFIDSIAGGGGLLALPSLLIAGVDPLSALATNKLQGTFGTASATHTFWKKGILKPTQHKVEIGMVFLGATLGVLSVSLAPTRLLQTAMPPLLVVIALYFAFAPKLPPQGSASKLRWGYFVFGFAPLIGFYDGIFGPGTGSFFMLALVALFGCGVVDATGRTKLLNFTSNVASLIMFALGGNILWGIGLMMGVAQFAGAQIGARLAISKGASLIRPLLVIMCLAMAVRLYMNA